MHVALQQWTAESSRLAGLEKKRRKLTIRAPISGVITDVADALHHGRWINQKLALTFVIEPASAELSGLVSETELTRLKVNQPARFLPDDPKRRPADARLVEIGVSIDSRCRIWHRCMEGKSLSAVMRRVSWCQSRPCTTSG
ncbi:MAG: HlyD family efflux transporter periplasmic adaptor subunit [Gammaproteobacteria bacterium]